MCFPFLECELEWKGKEHMDTYKTKRAKAQKGSADTNISWRTGKIMRKKNKRVQRENRENKFCADISFYTSVKMLV